MIVFCEYSDVSVITSVRENCRCCLKILSSNILHLFMIFCAFLCQLLQVSETMRNVFCRTPQLIYAGEVGKLSTSAFSELTVPVKRSTL